MMLSVTFFFDVAWMQVFAASGGLRFTLCVVEKENDAGGCDGVGDDDDDVDDDDDHDDDHDDDNYGYDDGYYLDDADVD